MKNRENAFDFLRLFAAVTVIVGHAVPHFNTSFLWFDPEEKSWFYDGVPLFFILSGFLIYKSCDKVFRENKLIREYLLNRVLRIVPGLYFYLILTTASFFIFGVLSKEDITNSGFIAWVVSTLFLIPVYHPSVFEDFGVAVVNGSLWTIPVEFSFYILLPLFVYLKYKTNFKKMISTMIIVALTVMAAFEVVGHGFGSAEPPIWYKLIGVSVFPNLYYFTVGILFAGIWNHLKHSLPKALLSLIIYIFTEYILNTASLTITFTILLDVITVVSLGYFVIWFGFNAPKIFYRFTKKIGDLSYGIYIWHMVVVNYFLFWNIDDKIQGTSLILLVVLISFVLGWISWHLIEKPALKYKPYTLTDNNEQHGSIYTRTSISNEEQYSNGEPYPSEK